MNAHPTPRVRTRAAGVVHPTISSAGASALIPDGGSFPAPKFECVSIDRLTPATRRIRKHPKVQFERLVRSIKRFGYAAVILVDAQYRIVDGHLIWEALKKLGHATVYVQMIDHLSPEEVETLRIAQHAIMEMSSWDDAELKLSLEGLIRLDPLLIEFTALPTAKVDALMLSGFEKPTVEEPHVARPKSTYLRLGDSFVSHDQNGRARHRVVCGDATDAGVVQSATGGVLARILLSDFPFMLVRIKGVVSRKHKDFNGAGMTEPEGKAFFDRLLAASVPHVVDGGAVYLFIDHRAMLILTQATRDANLTHVCTAVWAKDAGGMGGLYRHQVEFVLVLAKGERIAVNNVKLGKYGRNRTTLWSYPGMAQFSPDREAALDAHPTVKPVQLLSDAILDVTNVGDMVLDPCMGSGSTIVAAERVNRIGLGIEIDPIFFEVAVRRVGAVTGSPMIHEATGLTLESLIEQRSAQAARAE